MMTFQELVAPLGRDVFFNDYYEKRLLHLKRGSPFFYRSLLTMDALDRVLFSLPLTHPQNRLVDNSESGFPDPQTYTLPGSSKIDPVAFAAAFKNGSTIAMAGLHDKHLPLRRFCRSLEDFFQHKFQANIYLTPAESQGFSPHYDSHDVFILQVEGRKHWRIFENGTELPDKNMQFEKEGFEPGKVLRECVLEAGDLLYLPRGVVHDAHTEEEHSLHITVGLLGYTWSQYVIEAVLRIAEENPAFRKFVPLHEPVQGEEGNGGETIARLCGFLQTELSKGEGFERFRRQTAAAQLPDHLGMLRNILRLDQLGAESLVRSRGLPASISSSEKGRFKVEVNNCMVELPDHCREATDAFLNSKEFVALRDLPGNLDLEGRIKLAETLISQGFVEWKHSNSNQPCRKGACGKAFEMMN